VCFSGAVATLSHEIEWLLNPAVRANPPSANALFAPVSSWYAAVQDAHPSARILSIDYPEGRRWAARTTIAYGDADWRHVYVDPYTATVSGSFSEFGVARFFRSFHKQFYIYPGALPHGVYAVGPLGLILLLSLATGLLFYRFRWRDLFMRGPWRSARAFWSALHRATGMWTVPMAALITLTGVWYFVERALDDLSISLPAETVVSYVQPSDAVRHLWPMPIEDAVLLAEQTVPQFKVKSVSFSRGATPVLTFYGQTDAWLVRDAANSVVVDPYVRRVTAVSLANQHRPLARWVHTADPLHFGTFGGLATKLIWFAAGVFSSLAILLGVRVWLMRTVPVSLLTTRPAGGIFSVLVTLVVLGLSVYGCFVNIGDALAHGPVSRFAALGVHPFGDVQAQLRAAATSGELRVTGAVPHDAREAVHRVDVWIGDAETPRGVPDRAVQASATWDGIRATVDTSGTQASYLWLAIHDAAGRRAYTRVKIAGLLSGTGIFIPREVVPVYVWVVVALFTAVVGVVCVGWSWWLPRSVSAVRRGTTKEGLRTKSSTVAQGVLGS
jgi:uncharacterized iron-regulated membrane protein